MVKKVIPSLSMAGWIDDDVKKLDFLFSYYILTDYGQSLIFKDNLRCLSNIYFKYINDPDGFAINLKQDFTSYLESYFPIVDVRCRVKKLNNDEYGILLFSEVISEEGKKINLSEVVTLSNTSRKIIKVNNYGEGIDFLNSL